MTPWAPFQRGKTFPLPSASLSPIMQPEMITENWVKQIFDRDVRLYTGSSCQTVGWITMKHVALNTPLLSKCQICLCGLWTGKKGRRGGKSPNDQPNTVSIIKYGSFLLAWPEVPRKLLQVSSLISEYAGLGRRDRNWLRKVNGDVSTCSDK